MSHIHMLMALHSNGNIRLKSRHTAKFLVKSFRNEGSAASIQSSMVGVHKTFDTLTKSTGK